MNDIIVVGGEAAPVVGWDYWQMLREVQTCPVIMRVKDIRDQAEIVESGARQRAYSALQGQSAEIRLRACQRLGELSRQLAVAEFNPGQGARPVGVQPGKYQALRDAGLISSTAYRYEELAGGKHSVETAKAAAEVYFKMVRQAGRPPTYTGLRRAVRLACCPVTEAETDPAEDPVEDQADSLFCLWSHAIRVIVQMSPSCEAFAALSEPLMLSLDHTMTIRAIAVLRAYAERLEGRLNHGT